MQQIIDNFENKILCQFPCVPCSICSKLMYSEKSMWIQWEPNVVYPLTVAYPNISLATNSVPPSNWIAICHFCKSKPNQNYPQFLFPIPIEIKLVLLEKRKYLSSIFLHCSLSRTPGVNPFTEYHSLVGTMGYSQNFHSLSLYSGILGAFLEPHTTTLTPLWLDNSLINAVNWPKENNPYLHSYLRCFHLICLHIHLYL